jgi:hypothetical protein
LWLIGAAGLALAGLAAGYLVPTNGQPTAESAASLPVDSVGATANTTVDRGVAPSQPATAPPTHEFALSAADIRDSQEAPAVAVDARGRICLAWASKTAEAERTLFVAVSDDDGNTFSDPRVIRTSGVFKSSSQSKGKSGGFERRMVPLLAAYGDTIVLAWGEAPADGSTIRMMLAESHDGGQSFGEPICVHRGEDARPTFNCLAVNSDGQTVCGWLDSRGGAQQPFAAVRPAGAGQFDSETQVYAGSEGGGVCPCCLTSAAVADDGKLYVAYRNDADGYRDIWLSTRSDHDATFASVPVTSPSWQFDGCPHDGPSLQCCQGRLHVAWMDAHTGKQRAYYGRATVDDLRFEVHPLHPSGPGTQGNAKLCADAAGRLHAVWEESFADEPGDDRPDEKGGHGGHQHGPPTGAGRVVMYAVSPLADGQFAPARPIAPQPKRFQTRPAIACGGRGIVVAWNELDEAGKRVVVTRLSDPSLPPSPTNTTSLD